MTQEESDSIGRVGSVGSTDSSAIHDSPVPAPQPRKPSARATAAPAQSARPVVQPDARSIQAAVNQVNEHLASLNRVLELSVDATSGLTIATIKNSLTGVVLQRYPGADMIQLAAMLANWSPGKHALLDLIA